jgi:hypothetical protein
MSYSITIAEVVNGVTVTNTANPYTVEITEVVNNISITAPASNVVEITNTQYPVTVSYNAVIIQGTGGGAPGIYDVVEDTSPQLGGNLDVNGYKISSASNGDINIMPNGTGEINLEGVTQVGTGSSEGVITSRGAQSLLLLADPLNNAGQSALKLDINGDVEFSPGPGGAVRSNTATNIFGDASQAATITTDGVQNLVLNTNEGGSSPSITLTATGGITLNANGANGVLINETGTGVNTIRRTTNTGTSLNAVSVQRNYTAGAFSTMNGHIAGLAFSQRDNTNTQSFYTRIGGQYSTSGAHSHVFDKSTDNFTTPIRQAEIGDNKLTLGPATGTTSQVITTGAKQNLTLNTEGGAGGPSIILRNASRRINISTGDGVTTYSTLDINGVDHGFDFQSQQSFSVSTRRQNFYIDGEINGNMNLQSNGTGYISLTGGDPFTAGSQILLASSGAITLSGGSNSSTGGVVVIGGTANSNISLTPNGTGNLVLDGQNWPQTSGTNGQVLRTNGAGQTSWVSVGSLGFSSGLASVSADPAPALGGDLDVAGYKITTTQTNGDVKIAALGTGKVKLSNIAYPNADGSAGQVLRTNGSGVTDWVTKQDATVVNDNQPTVESTGQHWYRPVTGAFYTARNNAWEPVNDDGFF